MMKRELTCIVCPMGCSLSVEIEDGKVISVTGNTCPRGEAYANSECLHPERTITSTVRCADGSVAPVKTCKPVPKEKVFECMKAINAVIAPLSIRRGDVIIENIENTDVDVIATADKERE